MDNLIASFLQGDNLPSVPFPDNTYPIFWTFDANGKIKIDIAGARKYRMMEILLERNRRLAETDWQPLRAYEQGLDGALFARTHEGIYRQALRDIPQTIDLESITTPEELAAFEPEWPEQ